MAETIDEITIDYEEDGIKLVKEINKEVLSKGAWTTIMFRYKQWNKATEDYSEDKYTIRRYRKLHGSYSAQSKFNISSAKQGQKIVDTLQTWIKDTA